LSPLRIDKAVLEKLKTTGQFGAMRQAIDEAEHSIEFQLPDIAHALKGCEFSIVSILVGTLSVVLN
jgi:AmmeMemoRadiSam system protein B